MKIKKRRFGVSIPEDLAKHLDTLVDILKTDRSKLICEALKNYIHDHIHYLTFNECCGIIVVTGSDSQILKIVEEHKDVICGYSHTHAGNSCINTLVVSGSPETVIKLHRRLMKMGARYIPTKF